MTPIDFILWTLAITLACVCLIVIIVLIRSMFAPRKQTPEHNIIVNNPKSHDGRS